MALSGKRQLFVMHYLRCGRNATAAAELAGYSPKTARVQGSRLLTNADVKAAIEEATGAQLKRLEIEADDILQEVARVAFADPADAVDDDGKLLPLKKMRPEVRRALGTIEVTTIGNDETGVAQLTKVKPWDKLKALELLGRNKKLWTDKVELSADLTLEDLIKAAVKRGE